MNGLFASLIRHEYFADMQMLDMVICTSAYPHIRILPPAASSGRDTLSGSLPIVVQDKTITITLNLTPSILVLTPKGPERSFGLLALISASLPFLSFFHPVLSLPLYCPFFFFHPFSYASSLPFPIFLIQVGGLGECCKLSSMSS